MLIIPHDFHPIIDRFLKLFRFVLLFSLLKNDFLPGFKQKFPDIKVSFQGEVKEGAVTQASMKRAMLVGIIGVFILLSFQFRSYVEPIIVMAAIPLALIGVIWGHFLMGI